MELNITICFIQRVLLERWYGGADDQRKPQKYTRNKTCGNDYAPLMPPLFQLNSMILFQRFLCTSGKISLVTEKRFGIRL